MKPRLIAKFGPGAAIPVGAVFGLLIGCSLAWLVFSTHLSQRHPKVALVPIAALLTIYTVIAVPSWRRPTVPGPIVIAAMLFGALFTVLVGAVVIEMILCHYDPHSCINL